MSSGDKQLAGDLRTRLLAFGDDQALPGVGSEERRGALISQLVESTHRVRYPVVMLNRNISGNRCHPDSPMFDPLLAAIHMKSRGEIDESFWFLFLFIHFGKHRTGKWRYAAEVYRRSDSERWSWAEVTRDPAGFRNWVLANAAHIRRKGVPGGFGNHRKYERLETTPDVVDSYLQWIGPNQSHADFFGQAVRDASGDRAKAFDSLYRSMGAVLRFGRTARFDYLSMVGKLGLAPIEAGSPYLQDSTGPLIGARLLFCCNGRQLSNSELNESAIRLAKGLGIGMQVLEDALCNWQKSPETFKPFRG